MKEADRIRNLFQDLYSGSPWIGVNITDTLETVSAKKASHKQENTNSIWQIVNHMIDWRQNVLERVKGKILVSPEDNYVYPVEDTSDENWQKTKMKFSETQKQWIEFLSQFKEKDFDKIYPPNEMNYYENIHGIIQHDAYHLGQIVLLAKML